MVLILIGLISAVALPRISISPTDAFPIAIKRVLLKSALAAKNKATPLVLLFTDRAVKESGGMVYTYPAGITMDPAVEVRYNKHGFTRPRQLVFMHGKSKVEISIGLLGF